METPPLHTCQDLGLCQWRNPACDSCPNKTAPLTTTRRVGFSPPPPLPPSLTTDDDAPTWTQVFQSWLPSRDAAWGTLGFAALFAIYAWAQNGDDAAAKLELAQAEQRGYVQGRSSGYNQGSHAGLKAAHQSCHHHSTLKDHCDWLLAKAVVAYPNEVQP